MKRNPIVSSLVGILLVMSLALANVRTVSAEEPVEVQFTGAIVSVDELTASFVVETDAALLLTVLAPEAFDLTTLVVGEQVAVRGTENEDGSVTALWVGIQVELTGTVVSADVVTGSFEITLADASTLVVFAPAGFDLALLQADMSVEILGLWNEDGSVAALEIQVLVDLAGTVASIDPLAGSFVLETMEAIQWIVIVPEGFDWVTIKAGDQVQVTGVLSEDGSVAAETVLVQPVEGEDGTNDGFYCTQSDSEHPVGAVLAAAYQVDYATLQNWFCQGYGWGQIMLALQTGENNGVDPSILLAKRGGGEGWGQIWQELGGKGKPGSDEDEDGEPGDEVTDESGPSHPGQGKGQANDGDETGDQPDDDTEDHHGNPNDQDGDGHPDHANPHKPHNPHNP